MNSSPSTNWHVYILKCHDNSLYTGTTNDLLKRVADHNQGTGAKYTRSHRPVVLVYSEPFPDRSTACQREAVIKKLTHQQKIDLIQR